MTAPLSFSSRLQCRLFEMLRAAACLGFLSLCGLAAAIPVSLISAAPACASAGGGGGAPAVAGPAFVEIPPINISVIREDVVTAHVMYVVVLEVSEGAKVDMVKNLRPKLMDNYVRYLHNLASRESRDKLNDLDFVKERLKLISNKVIGETVVSEVLIKSNSARQMASAGTKAQIPPHAMTASH